MVQKRAPKAKKEKAKSIRELKKELWRLFSKYIRERDHYTCYTCGKPGNEAGHYYHSKGYPIHFEERAVHCQCMNCNHFKSGNLHVYALNLERDYGPGILQELEQLKNSKYHATRVDYEDRIAHYKALLKGKA